MDVGKFRKIIETPEGLIDFLNYAEENFLVLAEPAIAIIKENRDQPDADDKQNIKDLVSYVGMHLTPAGMLVGMRRQTYPQDLLKKWDELSGRWHKLYQDCATMGIDLK